MESILNYCSDKVFAIVFVFENFIVFVIVFKYYLDPSLATTIFLFHEDTHYSVQRL